MTDCLEAPAGPHPPEPKDPAPGKPITDALLLQWKLWGNTVMGIATVERTRWHSERKCIRKLAEEGQVR